MEEEFKTEATPTTQPQKQKLNLLVDDDNRVLDFGIGCGIGGNVDLECEIPTDFTSHWKCYRVVDEALVLDEALVKEQDEADELANLRNRREYECFSVINRGELWYSRLTDAQKVELNDWYTMWLNVTDTKIIPTKPKWL